MIKHGMRHTPEYRSWKSMLFRCRNKADPRYGARGITFQPSWAAFLNFYADMGPSDGLTLERKDPDKHYTKANCIWASRAAQANNRGIYNRRLEFQGASLTVTQWATRTSIDCHRIYQRLNRGWTVAQALTTPVRRKAL